MAYYTEIDSFVKKFKALCQGGRNASLTLSSNAGKAVVNLRVDLGLVPRQDQHHPHQPPNSPEMDLPSNVAKTDELQLVMLLLNKLKQTYIQKKGKF
jgi:hypothetical protein